METPEEKARKAFYRVTGKTPEEEAGDSAFALAVVILAGAGMGLVGIIEVYKLFFSRQLAVDFFSGRS